MRPVAESKVVVVVVVVLEVVAAVKAELDLIAGLVVVVVTSVVVMVVFVLDNNRLGRIKFDRCVLGWSVSGISAEKILSPCVGELFILEESKKILD